jgi:HAD superfamily phosphatase
LVIENLTQRSALPDHRSSHPSPEVIVFDMDGVLVEVSESYREAIRETVQSFTGQWVSFDEIQDFKNAGGWNNDWLLSHRLIADRGVGVPYPDVVARFNQIFFGDNGDGLILREKWMPSPGLLEGLSERAKLAIFTGRAPFEAEATLKRCASHIRFDPVITDNDVRNPKPAPDGLLLIQQRYPNQEIWYLGDTVDDARSAQSAGVPFIGVSLPHNPRHAEIAQLLKQFGAFSVIDNIDSLESLLNNGRSSS